MPDDFRCQYQSTNCEHPRARRENGDLHRLCELHRDKANETQRRWHSRHKVRPRSDPTSAFRCPFEKRALARLMAEADVGSVRFMRAVRTGKRQRCDSNRRALRIKQEPIETEPRSFSQIDDPHNLALADPTRDAEPSDSDIEGLTALVMEYNVNEELKQSTDDEFVEMVESWFCTQSVCSG